MYIAIGKHQLQSQMLLISASMQDCMGNLATPYHFIKQNLVISPMNSYTTVAAVAPVIMIAL